MSSIFGGSQQQSSSSSSNQAFPTLSTALSPQISNGGAAGSQIANLLGLNGGAAQTQGFQGFQQGTGYQFGLNQGMQSINGNAATQGLLNSGSTLKALDTYGQNYANTQYQNYLNPLQNLVNSGTQGAGVLASTGNMSQSNGSSSSNTGGLGGAIGSLLAK
jgi:hypothetical protein